MICNLLAQETGGCRGFSWKSKKGRAVYIPLQKMAVGSCADCMWKVLFRFCSTIAHMMALAEFHFHYPCCAWRFTNESLFLPPKDLHLGQDFTSH